ncbi:MAG: ammonium transporter, partial [Acidimicrobiales bacterium]
LSIMMQSYVSMGVSTILWYAVGYSLSFSGGEGGVIGNLDDAFLTGISVTDPFTGNGKIPLLVFFVYQMMFAVITPALITGAFTNRVRFSPYLIYIVFWQLFVYYPFVHMVWGGGLLAEWGVLDFAGGIVVHATAGMAALASVFYLGPRRVRERGPHSIPLVALGTGLLWFGWYGFNAGSELQVDAVTVLAFVNTELAASFAAITWLAIEWRRTGKPRFVGLLTGAVAGLATITPAAGFVTPGSAAVIGIVAGTVCYSAVAWKDSREWDDALDVWGVHGVGGLIAVTMLGLFATTSVNEGGADGLFYGDATFFFKEVVAVGAASIYAFAFTYGMLAVLARFMQVGTTKEDEVGGVDEALHGEAAYL